MWSGLRKLVRRLSVAAAVVVILLAVGVGALRIALTQLPSYREELQAWASERYGLAFEFSQLDTRLGLRGPELTFHGVRISSAEQAEPMFASDSAIVAFDAVSLLLRREVRVGRLTIDGTEIALQRDADGAISLAPVAGRGEFDPAVLDVLPSELEVVVRNSGLRVSDRESGEEWLFPDLQLNLKRAPRRIDLDARAGLPAVFGERIELALGGDIPRGRPWPEQWTLTGELRNAELAGLARWLPADRRLAVAGSGDISVWFEQLADDRSQGGFGIDLNDVEFLALADSEASVYDRLALTIDWMRLGDQGWSLAFSDVAVSRDGRAWPSGGNSTLELSRVDGEPQTFSLRTDFVRLEDLRPLLLSMPESSAVRQWLAFDPVGEIRVAEVGARREAERWNFSVAGEFTGFGLQPVSPWPGFQGLSGVVRTDARSGRVRLQSRAASLEWPDLFRDRLGIEQLNGAVVWRQGRDAIRVVSDNFQFSSAGGDFRSNLELSLPLDGSSPYLDLETRMPGMDMVAAKQFFPVHIMKQSVAGWLEMAIQGGDLSDAHLVFYGPLAAFPFDGDEGLFRVTADFSNARLDFVKDWPSGEDLNGSLEFRNAAFSARGSGRVLGNRSDEVEVGIEDMRDALFTLNTATVGPLADLLEFLNSSPLIAEHLGAGFRRVHAPAGRAELDLDLGLPLSDMAAYRLHGGLRISDAELTVDGLRAPATEVTGTLDISNSAVTGEGIEAVFMGGPVVARVAPSTIEGYRTQLDVEGETTTDAVLTAFAMPYRDRLAGQTRWRGSLHIPLLSAAEVQPTRIVVESNLTGVALKFPRPFSKPPADPLNLQLELLFPNADELKVQGNLGATRRIALNLDKTEDGYRLSRGAVAFGGDRPQLPDRSGMVVHGSLPMLDLTQWLAVTGGAVGQGVPDSLSGELELAEFFVLGQQLGSTAVRFERGAQSWRVNVDSEPVAGVLSIPRQPAQRPQIVADMQRLYLSRKSAAGVTQVDPRTLPGVTLQAQNFALGQSNLGAVTAEAVPESLGLRLTAFRSSSERLTVDASGSWFRDTGGETTRLAMEMASDDVAGALEQLGFDAAIGAERGDVTASLQWPGPPSSNWLQHIGGDVAVRFENGTLLNLEPGGAGRVLGLMSIVTIPRRLSLDFRDVFNKGLAFDEITADFTVVDGNAYTTNLILMGPSAEIGVIGRTGLRDRDYEQQAIVTAEPTNVLPTVGALVGGAGVGAALLIFTRIFKKPLRGIGQAAYCITGSWDQPAVSRITQEQLEKENLCAALPPQQVLN